MIYLNVPTSDPMSNFVKSFWTVDSEGDATIQREKIIPDGYPEMIFHYADPYRANISGQWYLQEKNLIAGQITNHFFLENTGISGMIGIKFQPWALKQLFDIDMKTLVNQAVAFPHHLYQILMPLIEISHADIPFEEKKAQMEESLSSMIEKKKPDNTQLKEVVEFIIAKKGALSLNETRKKLYVSERSLERYFNKYIGLSPKRFCRIIRFSSIFHFIQSGDFEWTEISFLSGFYDQSHFIKNFREFTGEDPSRYGFNEENMANLFLKPG